jgi:serine/threonine protein kinase
MELFNVSNHPKGGYGVIIKPKDLLSFTDSLDKLVGYSMNEDDRDKTLHQTLTHDTLDILINQDSNELCYKMLFSCDEEYCVAENSVISKLRKVLTIDELKRYTSYYPIRYNGEIMYEFNVSFRKPIEIKISKEYTSNILRSVFLFPQIFCQDTLSRQTPLEGVMSLMDDLYFLNSKGVYHHDIKLENILVRDSKARFIDFGSALVDTDLNDDILSVFKRKKIVYPIVYENFLNHKKKDYEKKDITDRTGTDLSRILDGLYGHKREKLINAYITDPFLSRYLIHKNETYCLAFYLKDIFSIRKYVEPPSSALMSKLLMKKRTYMNIRKDLDEMFGFYSKLLYFDIEDFNAFKQNYHLQSLEGGISASRLYLTANKKIYVVRTETKTKKKFIMSNKTKTYLSDLKGKYRYIAN